MSETIFATIITAPSSTKNRTGERNAQMHQTKKRATISGFQWCAANAERMADIVRSATGGTGLVFQSTHISDPVGTWIGGNSGTGGIPTWDVVGAHGSYTGFLTPIKDALGNKNKARVEVGKMWGIGSPSILKKLD